MASVTTKPSPSLEPLPFSNRIVPVNSTPEDFDAARDLPEGFLEFLAPLHAALTLGSARWSPAVITPWLKRTPASFLITYRLLWPQRIPGALSFRRGARINGTR